MGARRPGGRGSRIANRLDSLGGLGGLDNLAGSDDSGGSDVVGGLSPQQSQASASYPHTSPYARPTPPQYW